MKKVLFVIISTVFLSLNATATEPAPLATCSSRNGSGHTLTFTILTSKPVSSWCDGGTGAFRISYNGKIMNQTTTWNSCSKKGIVAYVETPRYTLSYSLKSAMLTRANGSTVEFECEVNDN
ncbi:MAG: hypothetical protein AABY53_01635 [Bdellovibrionota bacterium]